MDAPPLDDGTFLPLVALRHLARFHGEHGADPTGWPGATGHPLAVVDSLARHLFARYPTPRFLARAWFGGDTRAGDLTRRWFIDHGRGRRIRDLPLPIAMTRRMEHAFLASADHLSLHHALRRAEVLGLGGSAALADAVVGTRLGETFDHPAFWRALLELFVRTGPALDLATVGPIVDYLHAARDAQPALSLGGRTIPSLLRAVAAWHLELRRHRDARRAWRRSRWREFACQVGPADRRDGAGVEWRVIELVDSAQLAAEGRAMRHCVSTYADRCARGVSSIWSLRCRALDADGAAPRSVLTIELDPRRAMIVQLRGVANRRAAGRPLELVRLWASREHLAFARWVETEVAQPGA